MSVDLPALQVVLPLIAAPVCLLVRRSTPARILALLVSWSCLAIAAALLHEVLSVGVISYALGGWPPPWGIEYRIDLVNAYVLLIVSGIGAVILPLGSGGASHAIPAGREHLLYAAFLLCLSGLLGVAITGDVFNVFVFLEIASLASYALVGLGKDRRALLAAFSYLVIGTIGGVFILIGIGLMYQMTGTLNMADLAGRLPEVRETRTVLAAFAFLTVGISIKLAVFPLHQWLPNAYTYAPPIVSAFLAATSTKVSYYLLLRVVFTVFGATFVFDRLHFDLLLVPLSLAAMFVGSIAAVYQDDLRRVLAYSSIAQIGYMTLALSFSTVSGLTAGIVHLFNHSLMKGGLFLVVAWISCRLGSTTIHDMAGLGRRMPATMAAFVVGGLGLIGVPGTVGFISKWYLLQAALEQGSYALAALILLSSLIAVVYVWRIVEVAYMREAPETKPLAAAPGSLAVSTWLLIGASVYFGLYTKLTVGVAGAAARQLLGVDQ